LVSAKTKTKEEEEEQQHRRRQVEMTEDSFDPTFLVDFDFLRAQTRNPDDQTEEMTTNNGDFPCAADWKDDAPDVISSTEVSIDKARRHHLWKQTNGLSATGMPLCVMFEREDEAQFQVYERMCKKMFGGRTGNGNPNLQGMFVFVFVFVFVYFFYICFFIYL
jgi:hypothetical protein